MKSDANKNRLQTILHLVIIFSMKVAENPVVVWHLEVVSSLRHRSWGNWDFQHTLAQSPHVSTKHYEVLGLQDYDYLPLFHC